MKSQFVSIFSGVVYITKSSTLPRTYSSAARIRALSVSAGACAVSASTTDAHSGQRCAKYHLTAGFAFSAMPIFSFHWASERYPTNIKRIWNRSKSSRLFSEYAFGSIQFNCKSIKFSCLSEW